MTITAALRLFRAARKLYLRHPHDRAGANYKRLVRARTALLKAEMERGRAA